MRALKSRAEIEAGITTNNAFPRGERVVVYEPGDGTRITLLFLDLSSIPSGAARDLGFIPNATLVLWANPVRSPARKPSTMVSPSQTKVSLRKVRQELGCSLDDALPVAEVIGYVMGMDVQGAPAAKS